LSVVHHHIRDPFRVGKIEDLVENRLSQRNVGEHDACSLSRPRGDQRRRRSGTPITGLDARDADKDDAAASGISPESGSNG